MFPVCPMNNLEHNVQARNWSYVEEMLEEKMLQTMLTSQVYGHQVKMVLQKRTLRTAQNTKINKM